MKRSDAIALVAEIMDAPFAPAHSGPTTARQYEEAILDLPVDIARQALRRLVRSETYRPTPGRLRQECQALATGPKRTGEEAWAIVQKAIRCVGRYAPEPRWRDPIIGQATKLWPSWQELCDSPANDPGGRARFVELYDELAGRERRELEIGKLTDGIGRVETLVENRRVGS